MPFSDMVENMVEYLLLLLTLVIGVLPLREKISDEAEF